MTTADKIRDEKLQQNINREAAKIALLSGKNINIKNKILIIEYKYG